MCNMWTEKMAKIQKYLGHEKECTPNTEQLKLFRTALLDIKLKHSGDRVKIMMECEKALLDYLKSIGERESLDLYMIASIK